MRHPERGVLRRLLDEPAGVADADRAHVATCPQCLGGLAAVRERVRPLDAGTSWAADAQAGAAQDLPPAASAGAAGRTAPRSGAGRARAALRRPAVAGLAVAVLVSGGAAAAAADWMPIFRAEQVAPVSLSTADLVALPDLSAYGDVVVTGDVDVHPVPDAAAATGETDLAVPRVTSLPRGVSGEPVYRVAGEVGATFTFSAERAARAASEAGTALPPAPAGLDRSQVRIAAGPGLVAVWPQGAGVPGLVVGRAVAPTAFSTGVPVETVRDYLLTLPGLPDDVAAQLRSFSADGSTLPLPVPGDRVTASSAEVGGRPATVLETRDRTMAAVVWVEDGVVTAVAGPLDRDEVLSVARDLR